LRLLTLFGDNVTANAKRIEIAALTAPWSVIAVSVLWAVWHFFTSARSTPETVVFPDPDKPWQYVMLFSMYGVPTAYVSLAIFLPLYLMARRLHAASFPVVIALGILTCLPAAWFFGRTEYAFTRTLLFLVPYGVAAALCFHWIVRRGPA
jgi:uncharacterized membrane protein YhaH (DUF805 family)